MPLHAVLLYFGDSPKADAPDVGYAFELLTQVRPDLTVYKIQIDEAKEWGIPAFVNPEHVMWHSDYDKENKWGGFDKSGKPCSNTKQWVKLHHELPQGITKVFALGGGNITLQEMEYAKKIGIAVQFIPMERRFKGDMKMEVTDSDSVVERYGGDIFLQLLRLNHSE